MKLVVSTNVGIEGLERGGDVAHEALAVKYNRVIRNVKMQVVVLGSVLDDEAT